MALKKNAATAQVAPKFEDDTAPVAAPAVDPALAAAQATTAVAVASASSRAVTVGGQFKDFFKSFENALPPLEFGTLPRVVGSQGAVIAKKGGKDIDLGRRIEMTMLSFNNEFVISPGSDDDEARGMVKYSLDGKTIEGTGEDVNTYLDRLRTVENYPDATVKRYVQIVGILEKSDEKVDLIGDMVQVSLSPQAVRDFDGFRLQKSVKISRDTNAAENAERIVVTAEKRSGSGRNWCVLVVSDK